MARLEIILLISGAIVLCLTSITTTVSTAFLGNPSPPTLRPTAAPTCIQNEYWRDADHDGYGDRDSAIIDCVSPGGGYVSKSAAWDCDDNNPESAYSTAQIDCYGETQKPTSSPSESPTSSPSASPTPPPTNLPSASPTPPTPAPSKSPSASPSNSPSASPPPPTPAPSNSPSASPTAPTPAPPSNSPSASPSNSPSASPTPPTPAPSTSPSTSPTVSPTDVTFQKLANNCVNVWNGELSIVDTNLACQSECANNPDCQGVNYHEEYTMCYKLTTEWSENAIYDCYAGNGMPMPGKRRDYDLYIKNTYYGSELAPECPNCGLSDYIWFANCVQSNAVQTGHTEDSVACKTKCTVEPTCTSTDYRSPNECFLNFSDESGNAGDFEPYPGTGAPWGCQIKMSTYGVDGDCTGCDTI